jgi:hypothetical protein
LRWILIRHGRVFKLLAMRLRLAQRQAKKVKVCYWVTLAFSGMAPSAFIRRTSLLPVS